MNILPEGLTVNSIAGPWTNRDRVPLVTVIRDYETQTLTLSQVCVLTIIAYNFKTETLLTSETQKSIKIVMIFTRIKPSMNTKCNLVFVYGRFE